MSKVFPKYEIGTWVKVINAGQPDWEQDWDSSVGKIVAYMKDSVWPYQVRLASDNVAEFCEQELESVTEKEAMLLKLGH